MTAQQLTELENALVFEKELRAKMQTQLKELQEEVERLKADQHEAEQAEKRKREYRLQELEGNKTTGASAEKCRLLEDKIHSMEAEKRHLQNARGEMEIAFAEKLQTLVNSLETYDDAVCDRSMLFLIHCA